MKRETTTIAQAATSIKPRLFGVVAAIGLATAILGPLPASADDSSDAATVSAAAPTWSPAPDAHTSLSYTIYSHWLSVMDVTTDFLLTDHKFEVSTSVRAGGLLAVFVHMNIHAFARGDVVDGVVRPAAYDNAGWSRDALRHVVIDYPAGDPHVVLVSPPEPRREPVPEDARRGAVDLLTAMMKSLAQVRKSGTCDGVFRIYDGLRLTRMTLRTAGMQVAPKVRKEWSAPALRCDFVGQQVAGFIVDSQNKSLREPHGGSMWIEDIKGFGPTVVRVEMEHPKVGHMTALLNDPPKLVR